MTQWGRRLRAAIGMGLTWGATWAVLGSLLARLAGIDTDLPLAFLFAPLGFVSGIVFSAILVGIENRRGFDRTSLVRFAGWGAASGLLLTGVILAGALLRGASVWGEFLTFGVPLTAASTVCAAGSLALARRAERRALPTDARQPAEADRLADDNRERLGRGD